MYLKRPPERENEIYQAFSIKLNKEAGKIIMSVLINIGKCGLCPKLVDPNY